MTAAPTPPPDPSRDAVPARDREARPEALPRQTAALPRQTAVRPRRKATRRKATRRRPDAKALGTATRFFFVSLLGERVVADLRPGDHVLVRAGDIVPADGRVVEGVSCADEALLTGESRPVAKSPGEAVTGGSIGYGLPAAVGAAGRTRLRTRIRRRRRPRHLRR